MAVVDVSRLVGRGAEQSRCTGETLDRTLDRTLEQSLGADWSLKYLMELVGRLG